jgi:hypothetical protein
MVRHDAVVLLEQENRDERPCKWRSCPQHLLRPPCSGIIFGRYSHLPAFSTTPACSGWEKASPRPLLGLHLSLSKPTGIDRRFPP